MAVIEQRSERRGGRPALVLLAVLALTLILAAAVWALLLEPPPLQMRRLPDGTLLRLEAVTVGREHRFWGGPRWKRLLAPLLPAGMRDRLVGPDHAWRARSPGEVLFWATWRPAQSVPGRAVVFDEHGCQFDTDHFRDPPMNNQQVTFWAARAAPRRGAWIGLSFPPVGEFKVPNPAPGPYPVWKAEPLPITRRAGDVAFTLTALTTGADGPGPTLRPAEAGKAFWSRASFRITERGRPVDSWAVVGLTLSDATGNVVEPQASSQYGHEGLAHYALEGGLCVEEPAWKLRMEFTRMKQFEPNDLWVVRDVPITRRGRLAGSGASFSRHRVTLGLLGIAAGRAQAPPAGGDLGDTPTVYVQAPSALKGVRLTLVRATDDRGRAIVSNRSGTSGSGLYSFGLQTTTAPQRLDLTFALQRSRFAEFVAKPTRLTR